MMGELQSLLILLLSLCIEIGILFSFLILLTCRKVVYYIIDKRSEKVKTEIANKIRNYLQNNTKHISEALFSHFSELLVVVETFNSRVQGEDWERIKQEIAEHYLLNQGRKKAKSLFWGNRNLAARVFALMPLPADEPLILALGTDSVFLVRSIASIAAIRLGHKPGIEQALVSMAKEQGYARYFYLDHLLQSSVQTLTYIGEIALCNKDPRIHLASLEVFAGKTVACPIPFLHKDLQSDNEQIREGALKALIRNPQKDSERLLLKYLTDTRENIRSLAASGLSLFVKAPVLIKLDKALKDPSWKVRLQAAASLKKMGSEGIAILKQQDPKSDTTAYEVAQYAMDFLD